MAGEVNEDEEIFEKDILSTFKYFNLNGIHILCKCTISMLHIT